MIKARRTRDAVNRVGGQISPVLETAPVLSAAPVDCLRLYMYRSPYVVHSKQATRIVCSCKQHTYLVLPIISLLIALGSAPYPRLENVTGCKYCCNYSNTCSIKAYNFSRYSVQHTSVPWRPNSRTLIPLDTNVPKASRTCRNILSQNSQTFHMPVLLRSWMPWSIKL